MMHIIRILALLGVLGLTVAPTGAQDTSGVTGELRELRKTVDQQSKQIEMLIREVARLGAAVEAKPSGAAAPPSPAPGAPPASTKSEDTAAQPPTAAHEDFAANPPPKAEPASPRHIVVKGDTLTSIAKQYNITIAELQKANKEVNERKLQIGQTVKLPPTKAPAATPEPKPNP